MILASSLALLLISLRWDLYLDYTVAGPMILQDVASAEQVGPKHLNAQRSQHSCMNVGDLISSSDSVNMPIKYSLLHVSVFLQ